MKQLSAPQMNERTQTSQPTGIVLGFDPGGKGKFGWSICTTADGALGRPIKTGLANDALHALNLTQEAIASDGLTSKQPVLAAGIDAPLLWSTSGGRRVDAVIRRALSDSGFTTSGGTVQHFNSLRGACVVQGVMLAKFLHEAWDLEVTEAHPKAIEHLLRQSGQPSVVKLIDDLTHGLVTHKRDAVLSAIAAWAMHRRLLGWRNLYEEAVYPVQPFDTPVNYWMPIPP